jgi:uncharacterized membrane protein
MNKNLRQIVRRPRLLGSMVLGCSIWALLSGMMPASRAMLIGFDIGVSSFLLLMLHVMLRATESSMRQRAIEQDQGKWPIMIATVALVAMVLAALSSELRAAKSQASLDVGLAAGSIFLTWMLVAVMFSQQYAHSFYAKAGQLSFPGTDKPDYWDFLYFSVVLNMCFQTSDVTVSSSAMRRIVMLHSISAFFFNLLIVGITVNVVAGVLS